MKEKIKIILVDDETLLLESLEIILSMNSELEIIGKAKDGKEALKLLSVVEADLALVDLNMIGMGGIELIKEIKKEYPDMKVLVLTTFYDEKNITQAIRNGANGYLLKDSGRSVILNGIHNVMNGQSVLDGKVMETLSNMIKNIDMVEVSPLSNTNDSLDRQKQYIDSVLLTDLTKRELEICTMIAEGYTNSQIASFLFISEGTVKNYMTSIYDKTGIHDRTALAVRLSKEL